MTERSEATGMQSTEGRNIWGEFISLGEWGPLVDTYMEDPSLGPIWNVAPPEVDDREYDAIYIGGGAAGRFGSAFLRARGGRQLVIDKWPFLGGSCPHEACVPHHVFSEAARMLDYARLMSNKYWCEDYEDVKKRASIIEIRDGFLKSRGSAHGIMNFQSKEQLNMEYVLNAPATVIDKNTVEVAGRVFTCKNLVLSIGARPIAPDVPGTQLKGVVNFATMLDPAWLDFEPNRCVVIGGGKTAIEYGSFFQATGCATTIVTRSQLMRTKGLHHVDEDMRTWVEDAMKRRGIDILDHMEPVSINGVDRVESVTYRNMTTHEEFTTACDMVFLGTGERPLTDEFAHLGCATDDKGHFLVDATMQTSVPGVYACGDMIPGPREMFKARKSGIVAARNIMGEHVEYEIEGMYPDFLHSTYEVVWTGLSEAEAREQYSNVVVIKLPPDGVPREDCALPVGDGSMFFALEGMGENGLLKSVIDGDSRKILGLQFVAFGVRNAFQYLDYLLHKMPGGFSADQMADVNELFLNEGFPQLHRLRVGGPLRDL
ncbi:MAG: FAD-dependent oxidoreductase [Sporichthyaceae bacterium]